ncbi:MAG: conserved rane protein of unknown function [Roseomonas sp.]|nr:conserved rane protein of unknown function [Roseomonas sp.]
MAAISAWAVWCWLPGPMTTNSICPNSGRWREGGSGARPGGTSRLECAVTPRPATAAARSPLRLLLVQATRHDRPARPSASSDRARVMLGQSGTGFSTDALLDIGLPLPLPFLAGQAARPLIGTFIGRHKALTSVVGRGSILLVIYAAFSEGIVAGTRWTWRAWCWPQW